MSDALPISYEEMRTVLVSLLARTPGGQWVGLRTTVYEEARRLGLVPQPSAGDSRSGGYMHRVSVDQLNDKDYARILSIWWDLFIEGVVRPGLNDGLNNDLPFFHVTEWGKEKLRHGAATPYDPDGYLKRLAKDVPGLDPVIVEYLRESLHTFRINCLLSSAITLGCASEKALLNLIDAYADALPSPRDETFRKKTEGQAIRKQYDEFNKMLEGHLRALLPGEIKENLDTALTTIFNLFRTHRNEAGHPTGKVLTREESYAHISAFPLYVRKVYELIGWLKKSTPLT